jgi:hypothetical protein
MEPVSLVLTTAALASAVGGAASKWAELVWEVAARRWVEKDVDGDPDESRAKAVEQAQALLAQLALEVARLAARVGDDADFCARVDGALRDPNFVATLKSSVITGSRTADPTKRDVLARAVSERLVAEQDSLPALAATLAVEVTPKLSAEHIRVLALLAVIHVVHPRGIPIPAKAPPGVDSHGIGPDEATALEAYAPWLTSAIEAVLPAQPVSEPDLAHLVSTACIIRERGVVRDIQEVISPSRRMTTLAATGRLLEPIRRIRVQHRGTHFSVLWGENGLQSATLTPAGMLIGTAAYGSLIGAETPLDWRADPIVSPVLGTSHPVWDGRRIRDEFVETLGKTLRDLSQRRVSPWDGVFDR